MLFNQHFNLAGKHAFLSASKYHWVNYDEEKIDRSFLTALAAQRGTELHALAHDLIRLKVKLPDTSQTLNLYVNDAIGFRMISEQVLFVNENAFGTADTISFRDGILRISDLKTGTTPVSEMQLLIYAAFFCLEYGYKPYELEGIELRIYQNDDVQLYEGDRAAIINIMDKTLDYSERIRRIKEEAAL